MTEKRLLISLFFLFALSAAYLFSVNERGLDPDQGKDWWSLSFTAPEAATNLGFTIANHTESHVFRYTVTAPGDAVLAEGEISIDPGQSTTYEPPISEPLPAGRITITVSHDGRDETIYRSL